MLQTLALECHCIKANLDIHINMHIANLSFRLTVWFTDVHA